MHRHLTFTHILVWARQNELVVFSGLFFNCSLLLTCTEEGHTYFVLYSTERKVERENGKYSSILFNRDFTQLPLEHKELHEKFIFDLFATPQDNSPSLSKRVKKSDAREIESFYQQYYENYVRALDKGEQADR